MRRFTPRERHAVRSIWIPSAFLQIGMFVCALDRPWLETPFPLEGVMVRSRHDIETLRLYCENVQIDADKCWINVEKLFPAGRAVRKRMSQKLAERIRQIGKSDTSDSSQPDVELQVEMPTAKRIYSESVVVMNQVMEDARNGRSLDSLSVRSVSLDMVKSVLRNPDALIWLSQLRNKDDYAYQHSINVCILMLALGQKLAFTAEQLTQLGMAGLLQDVGVLSLPEEVIRKRGKLSPEEVKLARSHVQKSLELLRDHSTVSRVTLDTIAQHHERYDGSGYPQGLKAHQISLFGGIAGIADCFDAMVSERPYSSAISSFQALMVLYELKNQAFNAAIVERFIQIIGIYPIGSVVELNSGEVGIVVEHRKEHRLKPKLLVILNAEKQTYPQPEVLDLLDDPITRDDMPYLIKNVLGSGAYGIDPTEYFLL